MVTTQNAVGSIVKRFSPGLINGLDSCPIFADLYHRYHRITDDVLKPPRCLWRAKKSRQKITRS